MSLKSQNQSKPFTLSECVLLYMYSNYYDAIGQESCLTQLGIKIGICVFQRIKYFSGIAILFLSHQKKMIYAKLNYDDQISNTGIIKQIHKQRKKSSMIIDLIDKLSEKT